MADRSLSQGQFQDLLLLEEAAAKLGSLVHEVVFVGGAVLGLFIDDEAAAPVRSTLDVDVVAAAVTYGEYAAFAERLRARGFQEDTREDAPFCRWVQAALTLDVMPVEPGVLGFSNRWYPEALRTAVLVDLPSGSSIRLVTAPVFLGTKMEAFRARGQRDFQASRDLEDFIAIVEGRKPLMEECAAASAELRGFLKAAARELLAETRFRDALPGYMPPDAVSQQRTAIVLRRLAALSQA